MNILRIYELFQVNLPGDSIDGTKFDKINFLRLLNISWSTVLTKYNLSKTDNFGRDFFTNNIEVLNSLDLDQWKLTFQEIGIVEKELNLENPDTKKFTKNLFAYYGFSKAIKDLEKIEKISQNNIVTLYKVLVDEGNALQLPKNYVLPFRNNNMESTTFPWDRLDQEIFGIGVQQSAIDKVIKDMASLGAHPIDISIMVFFIIWAIKPWFEYSEVLARLIFRWMLKHLFGYDNNNVLNLISEIIRIEYIAFKKAMEDSLKTDNIVYLQAFFRYAFGQIEKVNITLNKFLDAGFRLTLLEMDFIKHIIYNNKSEFDNETITKSRREKTPRQTISKVFLSLEEKNIIQFVRRRGKTKIYKLNIENLK